MEKYCINIVTEKDSETEEWIIKAVRWKGSDNPIKTTIELAKGRNLEEAYSLAIKKLLEAISEVSATNIQNAHQINKTLENFIIKELL